MVNTPQRGVYTITCTANGRLYVGSSTNIRNRWRTHRSFLNNGAHPNKRLQADWDEHGGAAFKFRLVARVNEAPERHALEASLIATFNSVVNGYNTSPTGSGCEGTVRSEEHKQAISRANKGVPKSAEHRAKLSEMQKAHWEGQEITPEYRAAMAGRAAMRTGYTHSDETKRKICDAQKGRPFTEAHLAAIRAAKLGKPGPVSKLNADQVREIKRLLAVEPDDPAKRSLASIAREYGVTPASVGAIKHGRSWTHVTI